MRQKIDWQVRDISLDDYVELQRSPIILMPQDNNSSQMPVTPSHNDQPDNKSETSPRKDGVERRRVRERLDFGEPGPRQSREREREAVVTQPQNTTSPPSSGDDDKENFAVPKSPTVLRQPKTPAPTCMPYSRPADVTPSKANRASAPPVYSSTRTPNERGKTPGRRVIGTPQPSPIVKKHLQQIASLDDSCEYRCVTVVLPVRTS
jgi:hypothetical protein